MRKSPRTHIYLSALSTGVILCLVTLSGPGALRRDVVAPWRIPASPGSAVPNMRHLIDAGTHINTLRPGDTFWSHSPVTPPRQSGGIFIYGVSGTFAAHCSSISCAGDNGVIGVRDGAERAVGVWAIADGEPMSPSGLGGQSIRVSVTLSCYSTTPGLSWWSSSDQNPYGHDAHGFPIDADRYNVGSILDILADANNAHLIPIVDVVPNPDCDGLIRGTPNYSTPGSWAGQLSDFVAAMNSTYPTYKPIYFEIGNEQNYNAVEYGGTMASYASIFAAAAQSLQSAMPSWNHDYRILTGGMVRPSALDSGACRAPSGMVNIAEADLALLTATSRPYNVALSHLGVAVHPYRYMTSEASNWLNYARYNTIVKTRACFDLGAMINLWQNAYFPGAPLVFTEDNWHDQPPTSTAATNTLAEGAYLVDLFSWLDAHPVGGTSYTHAASSRIRVAWFRGSDADLPLGIYYPGGAPKASLPFGGVPPAGTLPYQCSNTAVISLLTMPHDYYWLRQGRC